ncbi:small EDRK-rich factor 1 isoform X1 [Pyxicephalus adspersus]|uniref:Small EDRK-rich factor-like N-terminal domain-containing protein n=1 Tax=Pyxicephalus adspersus TaxID=30357 RepID=A0AAV2ZXZ6_PYXAD|nr:TPA: hypothetical protein GDO54_014360 [Pyxicephalus adspersus]
MMYTWTHIGGVLGTGGIAEEWRLRVPVLVFHALPGGNQRELSRQKNLKKTQDQNKGKRRDDSLSAAQRKQRDSEIMQMKQRAADQKKSMQVGSR